MNTENIIINKGYSDPAKWHSEDTVWVLGLFGTAIGAGVLFLPINAGIGGFWPLLIVFVLAFPITYLAHRGLARFIYSSNTPESSITDVIGEHFGALAGKVFTVIYFFAVYTILIMYAVAITNTAQSFITHQLAMAEPPRSLVAIVLILGLMFIVLGSGLFKTCISVMVGTLYKKGDARRDGGFSLFYMGINIGSFIAPLISGWLIKSHGWHWGFGIGGIGMLVALIIFRVFAVPSMKRYDAEVGLDSTWNSPVAKKNGVGAWLLALALGVAVLVTLISLGTIVINPVAVASVLVYVIAASVALYFIWLFVFAGLNRKERARLLVCFILLVSAAFFWSAFEQKPTSFNLFANDYTNRMIGDFEIPAVWFQSINALFIILLAPVFSWAWPALARKNVRPGSMTKFVIGILCAAAGFGLMMLAAQNVLSNGGAGVSPLWLVGSILMLTLGELCLSPIGLATMTLLAPERMRGQMMGLWFCASALGNLAAGLIGGHVKADQLSLLPDLFARCSIALLICAAVLAVLIVPVRRMLENSRSSAAQKSLSNA